VIPNKITSANQHFLYVLVNIFTFNELWNVIFFVTKQGVFVMYGDKTRAITLQGSVGTLVRWGGQLSCLVMSNYVRNFGVKNY